MSQELAPAISRLREGGEQGALQEVPVPTCPRVRHSERAVACVSTNMYEHPWVWAGIFCVKVLGTCMCGDVSPLGRCRYLWACSACMDMHALAFVLHVCVSAHECGSLPVSVSFLCACRCFSEYTRVFAHTHLSLRPGVSCEAVSGLAHGLGSLGTDDGFEALLLKVFFLFLSLLPI